MNATKEAPEVKTARPKEVTVTTPPAGAATPTPRPPQSPFLFMKRFAEDMDRLFEEFGMGLGLRAPRLLTRGHELLKREAGLVPAAWSPQVDMFERDNHLVVRADVPGLTKDQIKVEVTPDLLTLQGERKEEKEEKGEGRYYSECSYGQFYRAIPLPEGVEVAKAAACFKNGVLEVTIPMTHKKGATPKRIEIQETEPQA